MNVTDKRAKRKLIKQRKAMWDATQLLDEARSVFARIERMPVWQQAQHILCYWSLPDELPTHEGVNRWLELGKDVYLPRVVGDDLEVVAYDGHNLDDNNRFHIGEPVGPAVSPDELDLIIVPAVALDLQRNRLGRGRGYYDRLLAAVPQCVTIGVVANDQLVDEVPTDVHDKPMQCVVTAQRVLHDEQSNALFGHDE